MITIFIMINVIILIVNYNNIFIFLDTHIDNNCIFKNNNSKQ